MCVFVACYNCPQFKGVYFSLCPWSLSLSLSLAIYCTCALSSSIFSCNVLYFIKFAVPVYSCCTCHVHMRIDEAVSRNCTKYYNILV